MDNKTIKELVVELTVEITAICDSMKGRSDFVNQLLRSCSSIGANAHEARYAQSRADFISKIEIALKESSETEYWLELLYRKNKLSKDTYSILKKPLWIHPAKTHRICHNSKSKFRKQIIAQSFPQ